MKLVTTIVLLFSLSISLKGQSKLIGNVFYQNSGWQPVEGIAVNANGSNGDYSKTEGDFLLFFSNTQVGKVIHPYIGENNYAIDKKGVEVELVNEKELENVILPKNPNDAPLSIIVAKKGLRDIAARKYYKIIKTQVESELDERQKEIIALRKELGIANELVVAKNRELSILRALGDSVKIYKEAMSIASINRDGAKKRVKNYLDALDAGISIKEARKELSSKKAYAEAINGIGNLSASLQELRAIAKNYETQFKFDEAFNQYDTITKILKNDLISPFFLLDNYMDIGYLANSLNRYEKAKSSYSLALEIIDKEKIGNNSMGSIVLFELGKTYTFLNDNTQAENYLSKSLKRYSSIPEEVDSVFLGKINANLGYLHMRQKTYSEAKIYFRQAMTVLTPQLTSHLDVAGFELVSIYEKLAALFLLKKNQSEAEKMLYEAVNILTVLETAHPKKYDALKAHVFSSMSNLFMSKGDLLRANMAIVVAQNIEKQLSLENPEKYNLQYAETLEILVIIKISQIMQESDKELHSKYIEEGLELTDQIEKALLIYPKTNSRAKNLLESNKHHKDYFEPPKVASTTKNTSNYFIALINLDKEIQEIEAQIKLTGDPEKALDYHKEILSKSQEVYTNFPNSEDALSYLLISYAKIASASIEAGEYQAAIDLTTRLSQLDKLNAWSGFIPLVLVNAYVLQGKSDMAWPLYRKYKNLILPNSTLTYRDSFLADIQNLEQKGVYHKDFAEIKAFLMN